MSSQKKWNLESRITEEEHEKYKDIRIQEYPEKIEELGRGGFGRNYLYKFKDGSYRAGKKLDINLLNNSAEIRRVGVKIKHPG